MLYLQAKPSHLWRVGSHWVLRTGWISVAISLLAQIRRKQRAVKMSAGWNGSVTVPMVCMAIAVLDDICGELWRCWMSDDVQKGSAWGQWVWTLGFTLHVNRAKEEVSTDQFLAKNATNCIIKPPANLVRFCWCEAGRCHFGSRENLVAFSLHDFLNICCWK